VRVGADHPAGEARRGVPQLITGQVGADRDPAGVLDQLRVGAGAAAEVEARPGAVAEQPAQGFQVGPVRGPCCASYQSACPS